MNKTRMALLSILLIISSSYANAKNNDKTVVNAFINKHAKQEGAVEHKKARISAAGDINDDGLTDLVVNYAIEGAGGGNGFDQYLAVFKRVKKTIKPISFIRVGGGLERHVNSVSVKNNYIELGTLSHDENDARCCPSIEGKTYYVLTNGELQEHRTLPENTKK